MNNDSDSATFWENHYSRLDDQWGTKPNPVLAQLVTALAPTPATALDLGCGHGGDAIWLATRGWDVTAVDVAQTALDRVAAGARAAGVSGRVRPARHDLAHSFPAGDFDLVSAAYFHTPVDIPRVRVLRRAAQSVAPGGLLIVVEHASVAPWSWQAGQDLRFPSPQEALAALRLGDGWHDGSAAYAATSAHGRSITVSVRTSTAIPHPAPAAGRAGQDERPCTVSEFAACRTARWRG